MNDFDGWGRVVRIIESRRAQNGDVVPVVFHRHHEGPIADDFEFDDLERLSRHEDQFLPDFDPPIDEATRSGSFDIADEGSNGVLVSRNARRFENIEDVRSGDRGVGGDKDFMNASFDAVVRRGSPPCIVDHHLPIRVAKDGSETITRMFRILQPFGAQEQGLAGDDVDGVASVLSTDTRTALRPATGQRSVASVGRLGDRRRSRHLDPIVPIAIMRGAYDGDEVTRFVRVIGN